MKKFSLNQIIESNSEIYRLIFFGILAAAFANLRIAVPGYESASSDPREVFVLIGLMFLSRWYYALILGAMAGLGGTTHSLHEAVLMHAIAAPIAWYFLNFLIPKISDDVKFVFIWILFVLAYYIILLVPFNLLLIYIFRHELYVTSMIDYLTILNSIKIEIIFTSTITAIVISFVLLYKKYWENEEKLSNIFNFGHDAVFLFDLRGKVINVNETMLRMFVVKNKNEALSYSVIDDYSAQGNSIDQLKSIWQLVKNGEPQQFEWMARRPFDGSLFMVQVNLKKVKFGKQYVVMGTIRDISEQVKAKNELRENEEKYRLLFESANEAILLIHDDRIIDCNQQTLEVFKCNRDQMIGQMPYKISPEFQSEGKSSLEKSLRKINLALQGIPQQFEWEHRKFDGTLFDAEISLNTFKMKDEVYIQAIVRDITERKKTETQILEREETLRAIFNSASDIIFIKDRDLRYVKFNSAMERLLNKSASDILHKRDTDLFDDASSQLNNEGDVKVLEGNVVSNFSEELINGQKYYFHTIKTPLKDVNGKITGICGFVRDITQQKKTEATLAEERERLAITLRSIGEGVITTDTNGRIQLVNRIAEELTGWKQEDAQMKELDTVYQLVDPISGEKEENLIEVIFKGEKKQVGPDQKNLISQNSKKYMIEQNIAAIRDKDKNITGAVLVFRDITDKIKTEQDLQRVEKLESLGTMAGGIAHDFNNMLAGFFGNLSLAKTRLNHQDKVFEYIELAESALDKATSLTNQLLTFARGGEPVKKIAAVDHLVKEAADFSLRGSNVLLKTRFEENLLPCEVDAGQMGQVIGNLVINAKQAMPDGGPIQIAIVNYNNLTGKHHLLEKRHYLKIQISDQGIGITQKHFDKIFDPYFTTKQEGNGLGLATAYSIIKKHHGHIEVTSKPGEGSEFTIYLPAYEGKNAVISSEKPEERSPIIKKTATILLMDDEDMVREMAGEMIELLGHTVEHAVHGQEAVDKYKAAMENGKPFDVVIMDLTIPGGMGGKEATEEILKLDKNAKIIVSSGYSTDPVVANYKEHGFTDFVNKPYLLEALEKVLNKVMLEAENSNIRNLN